MYLGNNTTEEEEDDEFDLDEEMAGEKEIGFDEGN